ncbi:hypothetical protein POX_f07613 [Penicillium oxalicum]|uniref:hypothetical protein n=1 Tax=Penicillium oxalicum TaxID=69781 RepID=UPI0020B71F7F|nr:hypothetical protein POX_f07613 [Penicillium oxalicum]KAI2787250.1 hypothetical protein POX_f07613 [Penicillium oxalicum]
MESVSASRGRVLCKGGLNPVQVTLPATQTCTSQLEPDDWSESGSHPTRIAETLADFKRATLLSRASDWLGRHDSGLCSRLAQRVRYPGLPAKSLIRAGRKHGHGQIPWEDLPPVSMDLPRSARGRTVETGVL